MVAAAQAADAGLTRVAFVNPAYYGNTVGGAEVQLHLMSLGLAGLDGYEVYYLTTDVDASRREQGVHVVRITALDGGRQCTYEAFAGALDSVSPDLVIQLGRKAFTVHAARYCRRRGVPFVFSAASDIDCRPLRELPRYFGEHPLRRLLAPMRPARALAMDLKTLSAMRSADCLVAQTRVQQRKLERLCGKDVSLFQNLHPVPPADSLVKDDPPMVLWLASLKSVKRPWLFLGLCRALRGQGCRLVMAGRMNEERFRGDIEAAVRTGDLEYLEHVSFEESNALIARARVFVLTSRHEGLPNTLIQAWLRRTPTVSLEVDPDGMIEAHGLGVRADTPARAAEATLDLTGDPARCDRVGETARQFAAERFGLEAQIHRLQALVDAACHAR